MKLQCNVEVNNRLLSLSNLPARRKPQRSILAIGIPSVKNNELYILLQTLQNKQGTRYKVDGNIDKVFTKFINDGKATIRMIEPPHDIIIQCDAIQLKSFIHILKLGISKKVDPAVLGISNLNSKNISSLAKTKIVIKKNSEYPILEGFPKTTEELSLTGLGRKSFDRQILRLQNLKVLNLSENQLSSLPKELGNLPHLQELVIAQNQLGKGTISKWLWLDQVAIKSNLRLLDISDNLVYYFIMQYCLEGNSFIFAVINTHFITLILQLQELPKQIGKLDALVTLKVRQNMLRSLPQSIGNLPSLRYLDLSKNLLTHVTGSMKNLKLLELDISENAFSNFEPYSMCKIDVPTLIECAARGFLKTRRSYNGSIIPETLVKFLDQAKYCVCGNACFHCYIRKFMECNLSVVANSIKSSGNGIVPFDCYFCSINCLRRYAKVQY